MNRPRWVPRFKDLDNQAALYSLLVILSGTIGASSVTVPNNTVSYAGFAALLIVAGIRFASRGRHPGDAAVTLHPCDWVPLSLLLVWVYGLILGFASHNRTDSVIRNFAGMTLYVIYYVFLFSRVRKFDLVRCLLLAAGVNASYMFGLFMFDKVYGRLVSEPTYFRFFEVRAYYSETLVLLLAPAALIVRQLLSPPPDVPVRTIRTRDAVAIVLLYAYLFAFLQISLSKATLLAYLVAIPITILFLGRRVVDLTKQRAFVRLAAVAGTVLLSLYPLTHLLAYVASADESPPRHAMQAPELSLPTPAPSPPPSFSATAAFQKPGPATVDGIVRRFSDTAASRIGPRGRVLAPREYASMFADRLRGRLIYHGAPSTTRAESAWLRLEQGTSNEMAASLQTLGIRYVLVQTAQPRTRVFRLCVHSTPLVRSELLHVDAQSTYAFELYRVDECQAVFAGSREAPTPVSEFVDAVDARVSAGERVLIRPEHAPIFDGRVDNLVYPGAPGLEAVRAEDWARLEGRTRGDIDGAIGRLGLKYVIVQTAQPRPRMLDACVFEPPIVRSAVVGVDARSRYAFELYAVHGCRAPLILPPPPPALVQSKTVRREMTSAFIEDLRPLGRGLGATLKGNQRDPGGYGFEQNYLNLLHKFGIFALVIFGTYAVALVKTGLAATRFRTRHFAFASTAFLAGMIMGFGNPTLMSPIMVTLHCIILYWLRPGDGRVTQRNISL